MAIHARGLSKSFGDNHVLAGLDLAGRGPASAQERAERGEHELAEAPRVAGPELPEAVARAGPQGLGDGLGVGGSGGPGPDAELLARRGRDGRLGKAVGLGPAEQVSGEPGVDDLAGLAVVVVVGLDLGPAEAVGSAELRSKTPMLSRPRKPPSNTFLPSRSLRFTHQVKLTSSLEKAYFRKSTSPRPPLGGGWLLPTGRSTLVRRSEEGSSAKMSSMSSRRRREERRRTLGRSR